MRNAAKTKNGNFYYLEDLNLVKRGSVKLGRGQCTFDIIDAKKVGLKGKRWIAQKDFKTVGKFTSFEKAVDYLSANVLSLH